ncbi:MAG: phosphoribosylglycinamide formyltransferase, partial [Gammaproteobacteria bacterium]|nr:phosphoribosylglycinamide formyltransferase [Gammaproteobacteria bacterium]
IPAVCVDRSAYPNRREFEAALRARIDEAGPELIVLAGFMRILSADFVSHYTDRIINIHPSLLPDYRGLDTHARALTDGALEHGATVHFVTPELDSGPIIVQGRVFVRPDDTPDTLAERVHQQEHRILPQAIRWIAQRRLAVVDGVVLLNGEPALPPALIKSSASIGGRRC